MNNSQDSQRLGEKVVSDIQKDFKLVGAQRVHSWYAWAIVGIVFGMALGIVYVANRSAQFDSSQAAEDMTYREEALSFENNSEYFILFSIILKL